MCRGEVNASTPSRKRWGGKKERKKEGKLRDKEKGEWEGVKTRIKTLHK